LLDGQAFGENIFNLHVGRDISHNEINISNPISDKMIIHSNMLGTIMLNWIGKHVGGTNIATIETNRIANENPYIKQ